MKSRRWILPAFILAAFVIRVGYTLRLPAYPQHPDAVVLDGLAWHLVTAHEFGIDHPTAGRPPAYPIWLALIYTVAGHSYRAVRIAQAFLGALAVWLLMRCSRRMTRDPLVPWGVGLAAALYPFFIYYEGSLLVEGITPFMISACFWSFLRWKERPDSIARAAVCGLFFGVLGLARVVFLPVFGAVLAIEMYLIGGRPRWGRPAVCLLLASLLFAAPAAAWGWRNHRMLGRFVLDTHGGVTFLDCVVYYDIEKSGASYLNHNEVPVCFADPGRQEVKADELRLLRVREFIRQHPDRYMRQVALNIKDFWRFYPRQDVHYPEGSRRIMILSLLTEPFLLIVGGWGLWRLRGQWKVLHLMYISILAVFLIHVLSCSQMRYRLVLMPFFILCAVDTAVMIARRLRVNT